MVSSPGMQQLQRELTLSSIRQIPRGYKIVLFQNLGSSEVEPQNGLHIEKFPEDYPYVFIDEVEIVAGRDEYWTNFIIQRKSDNKYFYITTYEGNFDSEYFEETREIVTKKWEFEKYFN